MLWKILQAMFQCQYKAWLLSREEYTEILSLRDNEITFPFHNISAKDKILLAAWYIERIDATENRNIVHVIYGKEQKLTLRLSSYFTKAQELLENAKAIIDKNEPPAFYKNKHCRECPFWNTCYPRLKEKDCISLLSGISQKTISKYHSRGIFSVTQLSFLFRPRRRGRKLPEGKYLWELKALALREKKTYVLQSPDLSQSDIAIYLDFEGLPGENLYYLFGALIKEQGKEDKMFSFWADDIIQEQDQCIRLFRLLDQYKDVPVFHYGSYELYAFRQLAKKYSGIIKKQLPVLEKRMINLLSYLRTSVYPPTYSNGLKEVAGLLGFEWNDGAASGLRSIEWRKEWETTSIDNWKQKLLQYNLDDCKALSKIHHWLLHLATNLEQDNVQQVAKMKKNNLYKFQNNPYDADLEYINKAAYFDYQRTKVYWRNEKSKVTNDITQNRKPRGAGKGKMAWQPKKVNEVIVMPALKACPHCGHKKLYHSRKNTTAVIQTDIKFTSSGIRQHVIQYQAGKVKCASCEMKSNNANLRIRHYGDNLLAFITYLYVNYNISNELVSRLIQEQFGIWISQMYLVMNKHKWWRQWQPEVDYIRLTALSSPVIHIDETPLKLESGSGYVWVLATTNTVFYHFTQTREISFLQDLLKDYKGIIITDFYPAYDTLDVKKQKCLIHLIRDLNDDLFKNPFDEEYKTLVSNFSKMLKKIIATIDKYGLKKRNLKKHIKDTEKFSKQFIYIIYKSELAAKYAKRLKKSWGQLWAFLYYDNVPWNNNNAEAAVKAFAMYRRGVNGRVSETGMNQYLPMLSIAQTCRYRNISFLDFLRRKKGLWNNVHAGILPGYLPFPQAQLFTRQKKFKNKRAWNKWIEEGKCPSFIPAEPEKYYKDAGWKDWEDWFG